MVYKKLEELKDKHKGEDIWGICAGSSMNYISSDFFENKLVIGQNDVFKHYHCDYVLMKDCMEEPRFPRAIQKLNSINIPLIFCEYFQGHYSKPKNTPQHDNAYVFKHNKRVKTFEEELSGLSDEEIIVSRSSVTSLIHVAAYMGAKNIILVGHDCGRLDGDLYYDGYTEQDWISAGNWVDADKFMGELEVQTQAVRAFLKQKYDCNIHSLNPFLNFGLEGHIYEKSR